MYLILEIRIHWVRSIWSWFKGVHVLGAGIKIFSRKYFQVGAILDFSCTHAPEFSNFLFVHVMLCSFFSFTEENIW